MALQPISKNGFMKESISGTVTWSPGSFKICPWGGRVGVFSQRFVHRWQPSLTIRRGKNKNKKLERGKKNRTDKYTLQPCGGKKTKTRWRLESELFIYSFTFKNVVGSYLSVLCACRAKKFYFPMCSNGTLTCKSNTNQVSEGGFFHFSSTREELVCAASSPLLYQLNIWGKKEKEVVEWTEISLVTWRFSTGRDGLWGRRRRRWRGRRGGAACSPSSPSRRGR